MALAATESRARTVSAPPLQFVWRRTVIRHIEDPPNVYALYSCTECGCSIEAREGEILASLDAHCKLCEPR